MELISLTVKNYRSITKAERLKFGRSTVLVGPNNEGKSNILRALVSAMNTLTKGRRQLVRKDGSVTHTFHYRSAYDWERDFPIALQGSNPSGESLFTLEFKLTDDEIEAFREATGSSLNGTLPLTIALGLQKTSVRVSKRGPGAKVLSAKSDKITNFVAQRLGFEYIPAVRTATEAQKVVDEMVERELEFIEDDPAFDDALQAIAKVQEPILKKVSETIRTTLQQFLPAVQDVEVRVPPDVRARALRHCEIIVDDGAPTRLEQKGDGVQSLAALGLIRDATERKATGKNLVVALEEPESHLHPLAMHELRSVLEDLASKHQLVMTTHCPLFVDRRNIGSNIIVSKKQARSAKSVEEVRKILGVRASDNLLHAELVLVVEGEDDRKALLSLLPSASKVLETCLKSGRLAIDSLTGGSNLAYKLGTLRDAICATYVFVDDDKAGKEAVKKAIDQRLIGAADVTYSKCQGRAESEFEDMLELALYENEINNNFGVKLTKQSFKGKNKWSDRLRDIFQMQGKQWDSQIEASVKDLVAHTVASHPTSALGAHSRHSFDALVAALDARLSAK